MLHHAHFDLKGGKEPFAARARNSCLNVESRHLSEAETGIFSAVPLGGSELEEDSADTHF